MCLSGRRVPAEKKAESNTKVRMCVAFEDKKAIETARVQVNPGRVPDSEEIKGT